TKAMAERKVPGVVVGLWIPGEGTYVVTRGVSELATGKAMQRNDHFRIGSIT
ncbi:MAG: beta-lactamase family protein, partial [Betaproteobacteria bacterium]